MKQVSLAFQLYLKISLIAAVCWLAFLLSKTNLYDSDFRVFYSSGYILQTTPSKLYLNDQQERIQKQFFPNNNKKFYTLSFINPPYLALLFAPIALLPVYLAFVIWVIFNIGLFVECIYLIKSEFIIKLSFSQLLLEASFFIPFFVTLKNGQTSLISLFLLLIIQNRIQKNKLFSAGLLASLLWYKPQIAVFVTLYWLFRGKLSFLKGLSLGGVLLGMLSFFILGTDVRTFFGTFISYVSASSPEHSKEAMISWQGFAWQLHRLIPSLEPTILTLCLTGLTVVSTGFWSLRNKLWLAPKNAVFAFLIPLILLCGVHVHVHDAVLLLIPLFFLRQEKTFQSNVMTILGYLIFLLSYFSPFYPNVFPIIPTLYLVVLLVVLGRRLQRQRGDQ
ncbi:DUF2029 domain-containing protein [Candidatus Woesebacteria bacterium]|nr:DUF2029 domain-containing protein [Candidatus Woesebacteria bacterium]